MLNGLQAHLSSQRVVLPYQIMVCLCKQSSKAPLLQTPSMVPMEVMDLSQCALSMVLGHPNLHLVQTANMLVYSVDRQCVLSSPRSTTASEVTSQLTF